MGVLDWRGYPTVSQPLLGPDDVPQWGIPENAPGSLTRPQLLNYQAGPLSQLAYRLAGSPNMKPGPGSPLAPVGEPSSVGMGSSGADVGSALGLLKDTKQGVQLAQKLNGYLSSEAPSTAAGMFGTSASSALGANAAGAVPLFGAGAADLGAIGAGGLFGSSAAAATGASAAGAVPLFGAGAADLGTVGAGELFGTSANAALGSSAAGAGAGGAGAAGAGGATSALGTIGAGAGYAALAIAAGQAIHNAVNARGDEKRNMATYSQAFGVKPITVRAGKLAANYFQLPDGRILSTEDFEKLSGAWYGATVAPDGNQADWQQKYDDLNANLKSRPMPKTGQIIKG